MAVYQFTPPSETNEGHIQSTSATVANARNGSGTITFFDAASLSPAVLFGILTGTYYDYLMFTEFDTSSLAGKNIVSAVLSIKGQGSGSDSQNQQLQARLYDYGSSLGTANWRDPTQFSACTLLAHLDNFVSAMSSNTWWDLTSDALAANINKSGNTRIVLGSSLHASAGTPTGFVGANCGLAHPNEPILTVTTASFSGFDGRSRRTYLRR